MPKEKETVQITTHRIRARVEADSVNVAERTINVVFATDTPVLTWDYQIGDYYEVLSFDASHMRLDRINSSAPVLDSHQRWDGVKSGLGVVVPGSVKVDSIKREATATLRFSKREDVEPIWQDIIDKIITHVSVGYDVFTYQREASTINAASPEDETPTLLAIDWEPKEISMALIPADIRSGVRSEDDKEKKHTVKILSNNSKTMTEQERKEAERKRSAKIMEAVSAAGLPTSFARTLLDNDDVTEEGVDALVATEKTRVAGLPPTPAPTPVPAPAPTAVEAQREQEIVAREQQRSSAIRKMGRAAGMEDTQIEKMITDNLTVDQVRTQVVDDFIARDPHKGTRNIHVGKEDATKKRELREAAIELRANPDASKHFKPEVLEASREYRNLSLMEMATDAIDAAGGNSRGLTRTERAQAAMNLARDAAGMHSSSDFPIVLGNVINRVLRRAYDLYPQTFKPFCTQSSAVDFREKTVVQIGDLVDSFEEVAEGGEYKATTMSEAKEAYKLIKYGRKIAFTWEMLINDDLGAFNRTPTAIAMKAAQKESDIVWGILLGNPNMGDGTALFHADHGNLLGATAIDIASLAAARKLMRKQKSMGGDFLNLRPEFLLIGEDKELEAAQYVGKETNLVVPTGQDKVNPAFNRNLTTIVEPRITGNLWFTAAAPSLIDTIEYAYLEGQGGLFTEQRQGFDVDGLEIKARLVFAAKAIDWRGFTKNPGA